MRAQRALNSAFVCREATCCAIMPKRSLASLPAVHIWVTVLFLYCSTCYSLKCRTDDGPSESELKRITRNCMRKIGENTHSIGGGSMSVNNNRNHPYGPLHQSNFGQQYGSNSRHDYNYDYDDNADRYYANDNNNNNNNYNNNNYNNNNGNYDRDRNALHQRNRERQQSNRSDNNRSSSSGSANNNGGRYDNNDGNGNRGGAGGNGDVGNRNGNGGANSGARNSGGNSGGANTSRGFTQNNSNNNNNNNNRNAKNDTADAACVVHCFFEELNMLNSDDYPDRYKVQYGLTRDLRDRELRNFYTDTIQDCFNYLESQRRRDKCHYSRDLINCMTEYAKVNCDDWQEFNMVFN